MYRVDPKSAIVFSATPSVEVGFCPVTRFPSALLNAYNFAKRLKILKGLTPCEFVIQCRQKEPERFRVNPLHHTLGLNTHRAFLASIAR